MEIKFDLVGMRIQDIRRSKKMTQMDLAVETNLSVPYISQIETGIKHVSWPKLILIAEALEVSPDVIICGSQQNAKTSCYAEIEQLLGDCDEKERRIIIETCTALKNSLKAKKA